jgi:WD40 repeat protein
MNESCTKVYSASQDTTVLEWDVETSQITAVCEGHQGFVRAVVVAGGDADGGGSSALGEASGSPELALSGAQDSCIKLWDMRAPHSSRCVATLTEHSAEVCFLSVVGDKLFSGSADATVKYWDIRQRKCVDTLGGHKSTVFAVAAACKPGETEPCMCEHASELSICCAIFTIEAWLLANV